MFCLVEKAVSYLFILFIFCRFFLHCLFFWHLFWLVISLFCKNNRCLLFIHYWKYFNYFNYLNYLNYLIKPLPPLIYTRVQGPEFAAFHKNIGKKIAYKTGDNYAKVQTFIRCKLSLIIIRYALLCLRGSRTLKGSNLVNIDSDFNRHCDKVKL